MKGQIATTHAGWFYIIQLNRMVKGKTITHKRLLKDVLIHELGSFETDCKTTKIICPDGRVEFEEDLEMHTETLRLYDTNNELIDSYQEDFSYVMAVETNQ